MKGLLITSSDELGGRIDVRLGGGGGEEMGSLKKHRTCEQHTKRHYGQIDACPPQTCSILKYKFKT